MNRINNLDVLLSSDDHNNSLIELDDFVSDLCSYGDEIENLTAPQRDFYLSRNFEREVSFDGLKLFFIHSSGNFAHETITSLKIIGAEKTASILQQAVEQFPNKDVPKDADQRKKIISEIEISASDVWNNLDQAFYKCEDNLEDLHLQFVMKNKESF